ncbi:MAG: molybdopterin-guanine dinucleotide biosynthesis protein MobB [Synergistaceae bacterium]|jgi:molybdopterin-guanine dinucleotide biosynthesis protein B|nr:molybdopterin-guanine dinucleotide biosynthesis protein MobB [Synergistaceae bacterium]
MNVIAVSGCKDSGKSTLCRVLISALSELGFSVGYIKRTQEFAASPPDTDSGAANELGVSSLLWGSGGSLRHETLCRNAGEIDVRDLAGRYFPNADVVILEGGKDLQLPKIWVMKENESFPERAGVFAVYDRRGRGDGSLVYGAGDIDRLVSVIADMTRRCDLPARVYIDGHELPMKDFVASFLAGGVRGMLETLKNPSGRSVSGEIRLYLKAVDDKK